MMQVATFEGNMWKHKDSAMPDLDQPVDWETLIAIVNVCRTQKWVLPDPA
jgi:hypothetical protein